MFGEQFVFKDREDAAQRLAECLSNEALESPYILGIPRGGVPIGRLAADLLGAPFGIFVARKIGAPGNQEFGIGAVAEDGSYLIDSSAARWVGATTKDIETSLEAERRKCEEYVRKYRGGMGLPELKGCTAILCDDGLATGITMRAAVMAVKKMNPLCVVAAAPVASEHAVESLRDAGAIAVVCTVPSGFGAVAQFYEKFEQLSDEDVASYLKRSVLYKT